MRLARQSGKVKVAEAAGESGEGVFAAQFVFIP